MAGPALVAEAAGAIEKTNAKIYRTAASASCDLLGQGTVAQEVPGWYVDTAVLGYSEKDRVDAVEPVVGVTRVFDDGKKLNLKYIVDSLSSEDDDGKHYGHALNPTTGWPIEEPPASVTVAESNCSKAGMLQGEHAEEYLEKQEVKYWLTR